MKKLTPLGVRRKKNAIDRDYAAICRALVLLEEKTRQLQNACPHENTKRQPDPSGGTDRSETCLDCGKEW